MAFFARYAVASKIYHFLKQCHFIALRFVLYVGCYFVVEIVTNSRIFYGSLIEIIFLKLC